MGAWGPAIFSDDLACDIRSDYRELLEDKVSDEEATQRILDDYLGSDEDPVVWLALAAAQHRLGRLEDRVRDRALEVIDSGSDLERWEDAPDVRALAKRKVALAKLAAQLRGPQPERRKVRRPWRYVTDLGRGDVLGYTSAAGRIALWRVARVDDIRVCAAPIIQRLDFAGSVMPSPGALEKLHTRPDQPGLGPRYTCWVAKARRKDPDWAECGFDLVTRTSARPGDLEAHPSSWYLGWEAMRHALERVLTGQPGQDEFAE